MKKLCRFCGKNITRHLNCINIFEFSDDTLKTNKLNKPSFIEKIKLCFPIQIEKDDKLPQEVCDACFNRTNEIYQCIQDVVRTQKTLFTNSKSKKLFDNVKAPLHADSEQHNNLAIINNEFGEEKRPDQICKQIEPQFSENISVALALKKLQCVAKNITISKKTTNNNRSRNEINISDTKCDQFQEIKINDDYNVCDRESPSNYDEEDNERIVITTVTNRDSSSSIRSKRQTKLTHKFPVNKKKKIEVIKIDGSASLCACIICKRKFATFELLKEHVVEHPECKYIFRCKLCNKTFSRAAKYREHKKNHFAQSKISKTCFVCDQCGKAYSNNFNLENHKMSQHTEPIEESRKMYRCILCDTGFTKQTDLSSHIASHEKISTPQLCDICGISCPSAESLRSHYRSHSNAKGFRCTSCPKSFKGRLKLLEHMHVHTRFKPFQCTECDKSFVKKDTLNAHKLKHSSESSADSDMLYKCSHCSLKFNCIIKFERHLYESNMLTNKQEPNYTLSLIAGNINAIEIVET